MFGTDHLFGSFDEFPTDIRQESDGTWVASALGLEKRHKYQEQALNDLNAALFDAVSQGTIVPNMGN